MRKAVLKLSNGEQLIVNEGQYLIPIVMYPGDRSADEGASAEGKGWLVSKDALVELWSHVHDGLIPSIAEFLCNCEFFTISAEDECDKIYRSSAVVSIENL